MLISNDFYVGKNPKLAPTYTGPAEIIDINDILWAGGKDKYLLALAKDSQADFLITGDQDLLILQQFGITKIVTYQQFLVICRLG